VQTQTQTGHQPRALIYDYNTIIMFPTGAGAGAEAGGVGALADAGVGEEADSGVCKGIPNRKDSTSMTRGSAIAVPMFFGSLCKACNNPMNFGSWPHTQHRA
jgi:hypothetical protein